MGNIFYNIASIFIGSFLIFFPIYKIVTHKLTKLDILYFIFSPIFLFIGIYGFFIPEDYSFITIIVMLSLTLIMILLYVILSKISNKDESQKN